MLNIEFSTEQLQAIKNALDVCVKDDEDTDDEFYSALNKIEKALGQDPSDDPYETQETDDDESDDDESDDESGDLEDDE
jgi:hypothetical protein